MASPKYTSINVLEEQHAQLKRIAAFKGIRITDLGVEMAGAFIDSFLEEHGGAMKEMEELEAKMEDLRKNFRRNPNR